MLFWLLLLPPVLAAILAFVCAPTARGSAAPV